MCRYGSILDGTHSPKSKLRKSGRVSWQVGIENVFEQGAAEAHAFRGAVSQQASMIGIDGLGKFSLLD